MKKVLFFAFAVAALAGCAKEDVVFENKEAISFDNMFVDNATRSIDNTFSATNLPTSFKVYGTTQGNEDGAVAVPIFNGVEVAFADGNWAYEDEYTQYWINGNTYNFAAVVNGAIADDKTIAYTADGTTDLLYAKNNYGVYTKGTSEQTVAFTFSHLLSKVMFTFQNTMTSNTDDNKYTYTVENIKITNAYPAGSYDITKFDAKNGWTVSGTQSAVEFGNITDATNDADVVDAIHVGAVGVADDATSRYSRLLIPNAYTDLNITCTITTYLNGSLVDVENYSKTFAQTFEEGKAYNFVLSKGNPGEQILFTVTTVSEWGNGNTANTDGDNDAVIL